MKTNFVYSDIADELCRGCCLPSYPGSHLDPCKWCGATIAAENIYGALKHAAPTRRRVPFYSDPRDNVPPAGYVVMKIYDNEVGVIAERQYKRALKNVYVNPSCGILYAVSFPVFIQRPDGTLYRPHLPTYDN